jgi:peptidoglycan/LPS O-acetylase OafA/YrhL
MNQNSLDVLRLLAAIMVLYSHQYAVLGLTEPSFMGWNTFGGAGVTVFFFLSGFLVWTSWERDPHVLRFILRRSLRIFPGLWAVCLLSVVVLGPWFSTLPVKDYFASGTTWKYFENALLITTYPLPGLFPDHVIPFVVNGSLWTLPVEFFCYITVAVVGVGTTIMRGAKALLLPLSVLAAVLAAGYGVAVIGTRYALYLEMIAMFWWGVYYGRYATDSHKSYEFVFVIAALLGFVLIGDRGPERTAMLVFAAVVVHLARIVAIGAKLTDRLGDLSYGVYIFAFPVQQWVVHWGRTEHWAFGTYLFISVVLTMVFAYASWHWVEKPALRFKPAAGRLR